MIENKYYINYDLQPFPIEAYKKLPEEQTVEIAEPSVQNEEEVQREEALICRACSIVITSHDELIDIDGKSTHKFVNPAGVIYRIGCFREANGCAVIGDPTREFTWFPGFSWSFALCSNCLAHLGWFYTSGDTAFYGLIWDRIADNIA